MRRLKLEAGRRALVVVAHPDDETIWLGGTILLNEEVRWTIFCLSRKSDNDRRPKFARACARLGARAIMTDLDDTGKFSVNEMIPRIKRLLNKELKNKSFDYCFGHGKNGEYGHKSHIGAHQALKDWNPYEKLKCRQFLVFNYKKAKKGASPGMIIKKDSDYYTELPAKIFKEKKIIQSEIHGYPWNGIDNSLCTKKEGFKIIK